MKVNLGNVVFSGTVALTLSVVGLVSQPAFAQSHSEQGSAFNTESYSNCGSHGTEGHDQHQRPRRNRKK